MKKVITVSLLLTLFSLNLLSVNAQGVNSKGISMERGKTNSIEACERGNHQCPPREG